MKISRKRDLEKNEKKKEMEKLISDCFDTISKGSLLKDLNFLSAEKTQETIIYNFDDVMRGEFLLFAIAYGLYFESLECLWKEYLIILFKLIIFFMLKFFDIDWLE